MKLPRLIAVLVLALLSSGCAGFAFRSQDVLVRHDPGADALELVLVSHGLLATQDSSGARAAADARGARHLILFGWPLEFDLEEIEEDLGASAHPLAPRALAFAKAIQVVESATWLDAEGEPVLYQRVRIPRASEGVALLSERINAGCIEAEHHLEVAEDLGAETGALWEAFAREGRTWLALEDGALVARIPMSPEGAARALEEMLSSASDLAELARSLSAVSIEDGLVTFAFRPDEDGWIRFRVEPESEHRALALPDDVERLSGPPPGVVELLAGPR